jgi:hypothetical protein
MNLVLVAGLAVRMLLTSSRVIADGAQQKIIAY